MTRKDQSFTISGTTALSYEGVLLCPEMKELLAAVEELGHIEVAGISTFDHSLSTIDRYNAALEAWLGVKK